MPTLEEQLAATAYAIVPPTKTIDLSRPVEFQGRREGGVVYMRISAETTAGERVATREFTMAEVAAYVAQQGGPQAGADFAAAAAVVFPRLKVFGMHLAGAEAVVE